VSIYLVVSDDHRKPLPSANWLGTVYHGMPTSSLDPSFEPGTCLAFLGRLTKEKGPETAIQLAKSAGMPLRMAANENKKVKRERRLAGERGARG
jgi:hypothetical protein